MANEASIRSGFSIRKISGSVTQLDVTTGNSSFQVDVNGAKGPVPGAITATLVGTDVDFSELDTPGLCRISNQDATNFVTVGIWDPESAKFYPYKDIKPGESWVERLSARLQGEYGTGVGSIGPNTNTLRIQADTAPCSVLVEAYEV